MLRFPNEPCTVIFGFGLFAGFNRCLHVVVVVGAVVAAGADLGAAEHETGADRGIQHEDPRLHHRGHLEGNCRN